MTIINKHGMLLLMIVCGFQLSAQSGRSVEITEGQYEDAAHFIISTASATYYYDQAGGGLSRMIDREGKDWIAFKREPWNQYPASAASAYRGIPNFVFGSDDSGAGHPGHEQCQSTQIGINKIRTTSKSGKWQWEWTFFDQFARVEVISVDPDHPYWFLYEGTPGGVFEPARSFFGTDTGGPRREQLDYYQGDVVYEQWQWAYFGHEDAGQILVIAQAKADTLTDTFGYLGNTQAGITAPDGMVVFGFGRAAGAKPLIREPMVFQIGFLKKPGNVKRLGSRVSRFVK